jgi:superoxide dismutase, Fe-Mn family
MNLWIFNKITQLNFDLNMIKRLATSLRQNHTLPKLKYPLRGGIPPCISPFQLEKHYSHHHSDYVKNLNSSIKGTKFEGKLLEDVIVESYNHEEFKNIFNNAAQHFNHSFYWNCLTPNAYGNKDGAENLISEIIKEFGSFENFQIAVTIKLNSKFSSKNPV